jgi:alkylation response protein AidB-like acyl-CoA dehydrogenase
MSAFASSRLASWLDANANDLDRNRSLAAAVVPTLAGAGVFGAGLAPELGGDGGDVTDAVESIAAVSRHSMAAGFVAWGHRAMLEYLAASPNAALRHALAPALVRGETAGATGLSNAMKFLSGLEGLQIKARRVAGGFRLDGKLPWVTNLRTEGFHVAAAVEDADTGATLVVSIASDLSGVARSPDLDLMAMRASNTAAVDLVDVAIPDAAVLTSEARIWLPRVRPAFLGMQCGLSIGLARACLAEARAHAGAARHVLHDPILDLSRELAHVEAEMREGLRAGAYVAAAARLFELRIRLAEIAQEAAALELQAAGGRAYLEASGPAFQRRWREAAFVPIITPSLVQLKAALAAARVERAA